MPKFPTLPTLFDECKTVSIAFLRKHQYLKPGQFNRGTISWSRNGVAYSWIGIVVDTNSEEPYIEFDYNITATKKLINYRVNLVTVPSNLGKGVVWFFECPVTGKRCRILYLGHERFLHREAFTGCMYQKQTLSHKARANEALYERAFAEDIVYKEFFSKHFKKHYRGKETKRVLKLQKKLNNKLELSRRNLPTCY
ncbi:MAG TPA: hypothetical protein VG738_14920 [Chitinophagaceae bacterium]|nr:hypothetical protein [Chitinophagaceae bacterium]